MAVLLLPIPTSKEFAVEIEASTFCLTLNETYPLDLAVIALVGEKANKTCEPVVNVVFLYLAIFCPLSLVIVV